MSLLVSFVGDDNFAPQKAIFCPDITVKVAKSSLSYNATCS